MNTKKSIRVMVMLGATLMLWTGVSRAEGPSYEDTLLYIQNLVSGLVERGHCSFWYAGSSGYAETFRAADLLDQASTFYPGGMQFNCAKGAACITFTTTGIPPGDMIIFRVSQNLEKAAKAVEHLVDLCGGTRVKNDLF
jgi:hypothetical protein